MVRDGAVLHCTVGTQSTSMFNEAGSKHAAECSVGKISAQPLSIERSIVLRPSEEARSALTGTEINRKLVTKKRGNFNKVRTKQIAETGRQEAKIRTK